MAILETVSDGELGMILVMSIAIIGGAFALMTKAKFFEKIKKLKKKQKED